MSDPKRWRDGGGAAPPEAQDLLRRASPHRGMTAADRARTTARIAALASAPAAGALAATWTKGLALAAGIGVLGLAAAGRAAPFAWDATDVAPVPVLLRWHAERAAERARGGGEAGTEGAEAGARAAQPAPGRSVENAAPPSPSPSPSSPPRPAASPATATRAEAAAPSRPRDIAPTAPIASTPAVESPDDALLREAAMLERARATLARDPAAALSALEAHAAQFPRGHLVGERELIAVYALLRLGRQDEARARARALVARFPASPYADRVRGLATGP